MSQYNNDHSRPKTFYEILEVDPTADQATIRKAYLRKSLKYHPDKNPNNAEEAKARFVEIGMAYETLSDETKRRVYDRELRSRRGAGGFSFGGSGSGSGNGSGSSGTYESSSGFQQQQQQQQQHQQSGGSEYGYEFSDANFDNYRDAFDATVAGMSEEDLAAAVGAVSALAGIVGGIAGSFLVNRNSGKNGSGSHGARGGSGSGSGGLLVAAGSMIGATVATEIAAASVRSLHRDSIQRIQYKEDCRLARERGQPLPESPRASFFGKQLGEALKKGVRTMAGLDDEEDDENNNQGNGNGSNGRSNNQGNGRSNNQGNGRSNNGSNNDNDNNNSSSKGSSKGSKFWKMAAEAVREAKAAQAANRR